MKKIAYLIGAALMIAGMFASCSLDSMSLTEKDTTNFPKTAADATQALAAIYQNLNNVNAFPQQSFLSRPVYLPVPQAQRSRPRPCTSA